MIEHFSDDNFKDAAKVYQSIKAPSDLRERVLSTAEMQQKTLQKSTVRTAGKKQMKGKFLQIASIAACLAIMVVALPDWKAEVPEGTGAAATRVISGDESGLPGQQAYNPETDAIADPQEYLVSQIPDIFGPEADPAAMKIIIVNVGDTLCMAEVTTEESITMEIILEKNTDTGCWEVTCVRGKEE